MQTVKPLSKRYSPVSIYVVTEDRVILETGQELDHHTAIASMPWMGEDKGIICAGIELTGYLTKVLDEWEGSGNYFNLMAQPFFRETLSQGKREKRVVSVRPSYFGFRKASGKRTAYQQIHHLFDPIQFLNDQASAVSGLWEQVQDPMQLMRLVQAYRDLCVTLDVPMVVSGGSFGSMMLRHPTFFPQERNKVSKFTNEVAAEAKIGQHEWRPTKRALRTIVYQLDQRRAHHSCAEAMDFPHSDSMRMRGNHRTLTGAWKNLEDFTGEHGLLYVNISVTENPPAGIPTFPELEWKGDRDVWVGTNEVTDWQTCGAQVNHVIAAITTPETDPGLSDYATWAKQYLHVNRAPYIGTFIKMLLFRPYGLLGMRPTRHERYYLRCNGQHDCPVSYEHLGHDLIVPLHIHGWEDKDKEPPTVNQAWRAMLERESRRRVIMEARRLHFEKGKTIVGIYADAIYVKWPYLIESDESIWKARRQEVSFIERSMYEHQSRRLIAPGVVANGRRDLVCEALRLPLEP